MTNPKSSPRTGPGPRAEIITGGTGTTPDGTPGECDGAFTTDPLTADVAEAAVLGAMLLYPPAATGAVAMLTGSDFAREAHRTIFEAAATLVADGAPVDLVSVTVRLIDTDKIDEAGGPVALHDLADPSVTPVPTSWHHYARLVRREGRRRRGITLLRRAVDRLESGEDPSTVAAEIGVAA